MEQFLSLQFGIFLCGATVGSYLCPRSYRALFLLICSYAFAALWSPFACAGLALATGLAYTTAKVIERDVLNGRQDRGRRAMIITVGLLLGYLVAFKLLAPLKAGLGDAVVESRWLDTILNRDTLLPLGISYYTFKLISYVVDVYWGTIPAERQIVDFAAYVSFFPQMVAGPIQRSSDFLAQIKADSAKNQRMSAGLRRILIGCFKKAVIADNLGGLIGAAYGHGAAGSSLFAFYLFPFQLYADFSALTDIANGASLLLGIEAPENFNRPFSATSISQYWRRWHITLTTWLTDYVFTPLRMATRQAGNWGLALSLTINMVLIGLWHEVSWTFLVFGLIHAIFLLADALTARSRSKFFKQHKGWDRAADWFGPIFTFHLVALAMVFVRSASVHQAVDVLTRLLSTGLHWSTEMRSRETLIGLVGLAVWSATGLLQRQRRITLDVLPAWGRYAYYYLVIAVIVKYGHNAEGFIYFKF